MAKAATRKAWEDRWTEPSFDDLLSHLDKDTQKRFRNIVSTLEEEERVDWEITWFGPSWKWTIHMTARTPRAKNGKTLVYLVPAIEAPVISVPLNDAVIEQLPKKRLSKYIRDGIRSAKCAVDIYWANYSPTSANEVDNLIDLCKRKYNIIAN